MDTFSLLLLFSIAFTALFLGFISFVYLVFLALFGPFDEHEGAGETGQENAGKSDWKYTCLPPIFALALLAQHAWAEPPQVPPQPLIVSLSAVSLPSGVQIRFVVTGCIPGKQYTIQSSERMPPRWSDLDTNGWAYADDGRGTVRISMDTALSAKRFYRAVETN